MNVDSKPRKVLLHPDRNGHLYVVTARAARSSRPTHTATSILFSASILRPGDPS